MPAMSLIAFFAFLLGFFVFLIVLIVQLIRDKAIGLPAIAMLVFAVLLLGCAAVNELGTEAGTKDDDTEKNPAQTDASGEDEPSTQEPDGNEPDEKIGENMSGDLGDYHVEIKGAFLAKDYEGNPAMVITYAWTNNSGETKNSMFTIMEKAFQDGVQLDGAILMNVDGYEAGTSLKEVRPGTTVDIQCAYALTSEASIVEFELTELISLSNDMVSADFDPAALG